MRITEVMANLSLCLTKHHAAKTFCLIKHDAKKTYWGSGGIAPRILNLRTCGGKWSVSRPGRIIPVIRVHGTPWIGGWLGTGTGLDTAARRKSPMITPAGNRTPVA
jgi:hypothetical protein